MEKLRMSLMSSGTEAQSTSAPPNPLRLISMNEVSRRVNFSKVHVYRLMKRGQFPRPIKVGAHRIAFIEAEVDDFIRAKIAERDAADQLKLEDA